MNVSRVAQITEGLDKTVRAMLGPTGLEGPAAWPMGQCFSASLLLLPLLRASESSGTAFRIAIGVIGKDEKLHVWIEAWNMQPDDRHFRYVIDPTVGQFDFLEDYDPGSAWGIFDESIADNDLKYSIRHILTPEEEAEWTPRVTVTRMSHFSNLTASSGNNTASAFLCRKVRANDSDARA
jgi:hypothetical protein